MLHSNFNKYICKWTDWIANIFSAVCLAVFKFYVTNSLCIFKRETSLVCVIVLSFYCEWTILMCASRYCTFTYTFPQILQTFLRPSLCVFVWICEKKSIRWASTDKRWFLIGPQTCKVLLRLKLLLQMVHWKGCKWSRKYQNITHPFFDSINLYNHGSISNYLFASVN